MRFPLLADMVLKTFCRRGCTTDASSRGRRSSMDPPPKHLAIRTLDDDSSTELDMAAAPELVLELRPSDKIR